PHHKGLIFLATSAVADRFGNEYYKLLAKEHANDNLVASPIALEIALSMVYMGAKDKTDKELIAALNVSENKESVSGKYHAFFQFLNTRETSVVLDIANSIYVNNKLHIAAEFTKLAKEFFNSEAVGIALDKAAAAATIVNNWVKTKTRGRIPTTVTAKDLDASLQILLINAFAFKGSWLFRFPKFKTRNENFQPSTGKAAPVKMMDLFGFFKAQEVPELDAQVLQLPYAKSGLSMLIFLPNKNNGLSQLEDKIGDYIPKDLTRRQVHIKLPKFKIEFTKDLAGILKKLNIADAFSATANLEDLVTEKGTALSKVIQKGCIEISEDGSTIASTIGRIRETFVWNKKLNLPEAMVFKANRPFAYVVRDDKTIYFQGHYVKPQ
ncbi:hypothetical protein KR032_002619, partial [Drosophila birchii]